MRTGVHELYRVEGAGQFRSRHVLKLVYRSRRAAAIDRHLARIGKLMDRIGATDPMFPPPRPKYMRRRTYERICREIERENLRGRVIALGGSPSEFG
jgi:hypothetical protein